MFNILKISSYSVCSKKIERAFNNFIIVQLSDLHGRVFAYEYKQILTWLGRLHPDIVVLTGDIADNRLKRSTANAELLCGLITSRFQTYFVVGNHEQTMKPDELKSFLDHLGNMGVRNLNNKKCVVKKGSAEIVLSGLVTPLKFYNDPFHEHQRKSFFGLEDMSNLLDNAEKKYYNILLAHNPIFFNTYSKWGADLVLSGHMHGGVICIPGVGGLLSPDVTILPKYYAGEYERMDSRMIVSRGLNNRFPFSISNPSEIVCVKLKSGDIE